MQTSPAVAQSALVVQLPEKLGMQNAGWTLPQAWSSCGTPVVTWSRVPLQQLQPAMVVVVVSPTVVVVVASTLVVVVSGVDVVVVVSSTLVVVVSSTLVVVVSSTLVAVV